MFSSAVLSCFIALKLVTNLHRNVLNSQHNTGLGNISCTSCAKRTYNEIIEMSNSLVNKYNISYNIAHFDSDIYSYSFLFYSIITEDKVR